MESKENVNLFVAMAVADELKDFKFTTRQIIFTEVFSQSNCYFGRDMSASGMNGANYIE
jgi:hypothetical protein